MVWNAKYIHIPAMVVDRVSYLHSIVSIMDVHGLPDFTEPALYRQYYCIRSFLLRACTLEAGMIRLP